MKEEFLVSYADSKISYKSANLHGMQNKQNTSIGQLTICVTDNSVFAKGDVFAWLAVHQLLLTPRVLKIMSH